MEELFLCVLRMSLPASYAILVILLLRLPLKKAPRSVSYALWSVAAFLLVCPVSFRSAFSLLPSEAGRQSANIAVRRAAQAAAAVLPAQGSGGGAAFAASPVSVGAGIVPLLTEIGTALWLAGIAAMLAYQAVSLLLLRGRLKGERQAGRGIREAEGLRTPFVLGVFRPAIYLPAGLPAVEREIVVQGGREPGFPPVSRVWRKRGGAKRTRLVLPRPKAEISPFLHMRERPGRFRIRRTPRTD